MLVKSGKFGRFCKDFLWKFFSTTAFCLKRVSSLTLVVSCRMELCYEKLDATADSVDRSHLEEMIRNCELEISRIKYDADLLAVTLSPA